MKEKLLVVIISINKKREYRGESIKIDIITFIDI